MLCLAFYSLAILLCQIHPSLALFHGQFMKLPVLLWILLAPINCHALHPGRSSSMMISSNSVCSARNSKLASDSVIVSETPVWYGCIGDIADSDASTFFRAFVLLHNLLGSPSLSFFAALILFTRAFEVSSGRPLVSLISLGAQVAAIC